jgi:BirA family biotin operon repressor/biotin-[acetyl-CoA-carboxylase] ligase
MTLILSPSVEAEQLQMITVAAADAVCLALEELAPLRPMIKWVNDIFLRGSDGRERKVCGILTEAVAGHAGVGIERVVVGIGLNLTTRSFDGDVGAAGSIWPDGLPDGVGRERVAARIAGRLADFAARLSSAECRGYLIDVYRERSMLLGREISYIHGDMKRYGRAVGIDGSGGLIVEDITGKRETLRSGEVHEVRPSDDNIHNRKDTKGDNRNDGKE